MAEVAGPLEAVRIPYPHASISNMNFSHINLRATNITCRTPEVFSYNPLKTKPVNLNDS